MAFPDPANSPAYYAHTLRVSYEDITVENAGEGGWIWAFSNVVQLVVTSGARNFHFTSFPRLLTPSNLHS